MSVRSLFSFLSGSSRRRGLIAGVMAATLCFSAASPARASFFGFDAQAVLTRSGGQVVPCIKIKPAPNPDYFGLKQSMAADAGGHPVITLSNRGGNRYSMLLTAADAATGVRLQIFPPGPCRTLECSRSNSIPVVVTTADGTTLIYHLTITSNDGVLDPGSIYSFNPQPDPPGDWSGATEVLFNLTSPNGSPSSVNITVSLTAGTQLLPLE